MKIGIDLGGSKIEGIILTKDGNELNRLRIASPGNSYKDLIKTVCILVSELCKTHGVADDVPIGIGIPGTLSPITGLVKNANTTCLIGKPFDKDLASNLNRPVKLANDANCFTISESTDGAGKNYDVVFGVILGTGVGGGLSINGQAWTGPNSISGEWGHNPLPWISTDDLKDETSSRCYCGKRGCIETFLSGPGIVRDFRLAFGTATTPTEIVENAYNGEEPAVTVLARYESRLARALANVINIVDPEVIVLGGGLSNIESLYENVPKLWQDWVFSDQCVTKLVKNVHGDSSGVRGAAWLW